MEELEATTTFLFAFWFKKEEREEEAWTAMFIFTIQVKNQ